MSRRSIFFGRASHRSAYGIPMRLFYGLWDAENAGSITQSGGVVSSWLDLVGRYNFVQAVSASKPAYSVSGFNGRPVITGDGVDDEMTTTTGTPFPAGDLPCEVWLLFDQLTAAGDTATKNLAGWGTLNATSRQVTRVVTTGVNRARVSIGDGAAAQTVSQTTVDLSGRHLIRAQLGAAQTIVAVDAVDSSPLSVIPSTPFTRARVFAGNGSSASGFSNIGINLFAVTAPLSASQAAAFTAYCNIRKG